MKTSQVVILCGGFGTRLSQFTQDIPKPMVKIGNMPILWHIMKYFSFFGYKDFILCVGYKSEIIKDFFINYKANFSDSVLNLKSNNLTLLKYSNSNVEDWKITFVDSGLEALTGYRIHSVKKFIKEDNFFLTYGDAVGNIDLNKLLSLHEKTNKILTVTGVHPPARFGELVFENDSVVSFNEKPQTSTGLINGGFFVCKKNIFNYLSGKEDETFEEEPIQKLVSEKQMSVYKHPDFWQPMDSMREYKILNKMWESGNPIWKIWK